jgi:hypothetical protein
MTCCTAYYRWKRQLDRHGPEILRPRERRTPRMANQTSVLVEQRVVAFALGHPGFGPARIAAELARPKWGGIVLPANGIWRVLRRHGLSTRAKRYGLVAGYGAPPEPQRPAPLVGHPMVAAESSLRRRSRTCPRSSPLGSPSAVVAVGLQCELQESVGDLLALPRQGVQDLARGDEPPADQLVLGLPGVELDRAHQRLW